MKHLIFCLLVLFATHVLFAQKADQTTTIILVRHGEKDPNGGDDPGLTPAGKMRALKLAGMFPNAQPDEMYSTPLVRTRETLAPWAEKVGLEIKTYRTADLPDFADQLKAMIGKTVVVAGHSNTTPALANLLLNTDRYKDWEDGVYNKLFVITIVKGKAKGKVIEY